MRKLERLACQWMGKRMEKVRHKQGLTAAEVARRTSHKASHYRLKELGQQRISLDFLLRAWLALDVEIDRLWFPVAERVEVADESTAEAILLDLLELQQLVTAEQVVQVTAEVFQIPCRALTSGDGHRRIREARTAAAFVFERIHHLRLVDLARLVRRSPRTLAHAREQVRYDMDPDFFRKFQAIRQGVGEL